jgi:hypothetical protein
MLTSNRRAKIICWSLLALAVTVIVLRVSPQRSANGGGLVFARMIWIAGLLGLVIARSLGLQKRLNRSLAFVALGAVLLYWSGLAWAHHAAFQNASVDANQIAAQRGERFIRVAATPTAANPFQWLCIAETDRAMYRFFVGVRGQSDGAEGAPWSGNQSQTDSVPAIERYEKPTGQSGQMVSVASRDPRAQIFLGFARFPIARVENENCIGQTLVQFADLRYTEPGTSRGTFSLEVPVQCSGP